MIFYFTLLAKHITIMKYLLHTTLFLLMALSAFTASARKAKLLEGSPESLKGIKKLNIRFVYDGMTIGKKQIPEADYIVQRTKEKNDKEAGTGDVWAKAWINDRTRRFEPALKSYFNKEASGVRLGDFPEEKYTLIFKTTNTEPGFNVGVSSKPARVSGEAWIVETANPEHVICKLAVEDCPGAMSGFDFDNGERIRMSYAVAGQMLGAYFKRILK